jgi:hypothetical protein
MENLIKYLHITFQVALITFDFSKAKPGDKVRVKPFDKEKSYQFGTTKKMVSLEKKILTIKSITKTKPDLSKDKPANYLITLKEDNNGWSWSDAMLELLTEYKSCDIIEEAKLSLKRIEQIKKWLNEDIKESK